MSLILVVQNKEKVLDTAVWFCFTIVLLAFQANNITLRHSCRYCLCLTNFGSMFPFVFPENIKNLSLFVVFKGHGNLTLTSTGFILVVYRNYNDLQFFCFENY